MAYAARFNLSDAPARIALLAVRTAAKPTAAGSLYLNGEPLTLEAVARRLTHMPKPLCVSGTLIDGQLHIHAGPFEEGSISLQLFHDFQEACNNSGGAVDFVAHHHQGDISGLGIICVGHGEILRVTVQDVQNWQRDYWVEQFGFAADVPDSPYVVGLGLSPADLEGAVAVIGFDSGGGSWESSVDGVVDMRGRF